MLAVPSASQAASLTQVTSDWKGGGTFPSDVTMWIYVPPKVASNPSANPPLLTLIHSCGSNAQVVFGQATSNGTTSGGVVQAADQYGFIIMAPSSGSNNRCWDVVSGNTRKRDGGADSHAIKQMVKYTIEKYKANADRVYATGCSSGAMMTQLLLSLYPDIFKAGSSFAGMPAGCGTTMPSPGSYDGSCAGGNVTHTGAEWADIAKKMDPDYTGHRPRLQLVHGDQDEFISYKNQAESVKEYISLLGLQTTPTATQKNFTLGDEAHQATREQWKNSCGYLVLEDFTSIGGKHGPPDALFPAQYVIPFLGLDKPGDVDPEIAQCGGGTGGTGGNGGTGGSTGGTTGGNTAGTGGNTAGTGGHAGGNTGGTSGTSGGSTGGSTGGVSGGATGGSTGGSTQPTGGSGGSSPTGGNSTGGTHSTGGAAGNTTGGSTGGGSGGGGCSFTLAHSQTGVTILSLLGLAFVLSARRKRQ